MAVRLPEEKNPYGGRTPFDVLGVPPTADARQIVVARDERLDDINNHHPPYADDERLELIKEVKEAYRAVGDARARAEVEMFFYDSSVGEEGCRRQAERHTDLAFDFSRILERAEDILPAEPDIQRATDDFRDVPLGSGLRLRTEGTSFERDPRREALDAIRFEI